MTQCINCGKADLSDKDKFCPNCGYAQQPDIAPPTVRYEQCEIRVDEVERGAPDPLFKVVWPQWRFRATAFGASGDYTEATSSPFFAHALEERGSVGPAFEHSSCEALSEFVDQLQSAAGRERA